MHPSAFERTSGEGCAAPPRIHATHIATTSQDECLAWMHAAGLDVRHNHMSSGPYVAELEFVALSNELRFSQSYYSAAIATRGAPPPGVYTFSLLDAVPGGMYFNQQPLGEREVAVVRPGEEFFISRPGGMRSLVVYADAGLVDRRCAALHGVSAQAYFRGGTSVRADRAAVAACTQQFSRIGRQAFAGTLTIRNQDHAARLSEQLVDSVLGAIEQPERLGGWSGRQRLLDQAWDIIENDTSVTSVGRLCTIIGVPIRTLDSAFRAGVGISPKRFMLAIRLNQARKQLAHPGDGITVTHAATSLGFFHFGHFCRHYRDLFGETPSQTLHHARRSSSARLGGFH